MERPSRGAAANTVHPLWRACSMTVATSSASATGMRNALPMAPRSAFPAERVSRCSGDDDTCGLCGVCGSYDRAEIAGVLHAHRRHDTPVDGALHHPCDRRRPMVCQRHGSGCAPDWTDRRHDRIGGRDDVGAIRFEFVNERGDAGLAAPKRRRRDDHGLERNRGASRVVHEAHTVDSAHGCAWLGADAPPSETG